MLAQKAWSTLARHLRRELSNSKQGVAILVRTNLIRNSCEKPFDQLFIELVLFVKKQQAFFKLGRALSFCLSLFLDVFRSVVFLGCTNYASEMNENARTIQQSGEIAENAENLISEA